MVVIDRQPHMQMKALSAITALSQNINAAASAALQPYVENWTMETVERPLGVAHDREMYERIL